jgi:tyrosinase
MVDKLWDDWQRRRPENFWSYQGGTIGAHSASGIYSQFPNGGPPFLDVRVLVLYMEISIDPPVYQFGSDIPSDGLLNKATLFKLMDTRAYDFCYVYE